jgi:hypothetical protein
MIAHDRPRFWRVGHERHRRGRHALAAGLRRGVVRPRRRINQNRERACGRLARDRAISECGLAARKAIASVRSFEAVMAEHVLAWKHLRRCFDVHMQPAGPPWLFCTRRGESYVKPNGTANGWDSLWQRFMAKVLKQTQVGERFTEHDLRAKCASDAPSLERAQQLLAHADKALTASLPAQTQACEAAEVVLAVLEEIVRIYRF